MAVPVKEADCLFHREFSSYVNLGNSINLSTEAKEVLVFILSDLSDG
jgi:hypothetical protein